MDNKQKKVVSAIVKDFQKKNKRNPKDDKELAQFVQSQGGDKYIKRKTQEVLGGQTQEQKQTPEQKQKVAHGAKLNYIKNLKHQCADDEELVYYKTGGKVDCGCKKKGGEMKPEKECGGGAVAKFKVARKAQSGTKLKKDQAAKDSIEINSRQGNDEKEATRPGSYKPNPKHDPTNPNSRTHIWVPDRTKPPYNQRREEPEQPKVTKPKSVSSGKKDSSKHIKSMYLKEKGGAVEKFKSARCGSKMKNK